MIEEDYRSWPLASTHCTHSQCLHASKKELENVYLCLWKDFSENFSEMNNLHSVKIPNPEWHGQLLRLCNIGMYVVRELFTLPLCCRVSSNRLTQISHRDIGKLRKSAREGQEERRGDWGGFLRLFECENVESKVSQSPLCFFLEFIRFLSQCLTPEFLLVTTTI